MRVMPSRTTLTRPPHSIRMRPTLSAALAIFSRSRWRRTTGSADALIGLPLPAPAGGTPAKPSPPVPAARLLRKPPRQRARRETIWRSLESPYHIAVSEQWSSWAGERCQCRGVWRSKRLLRLFAETRHGEPEGSHGRRSRTRSDASRLQSGSRRVDQGDPRRRSAGLSQSLGRRSRPMGGCIFTKRAFATRSKPPRSNTRTRCARNFSTSNRISASRPRSSQRRRLACWGERHMPLRAALLAEELGNRPRRRRAAELCATCNRAGFANGAAATSSAWAGRSVDGGAAKRDRAPCRRGRWPRFLFLADALSERVYKGGGAVGRRGFPERNRPGLAGLRRQIGKRSPVDAIKC